MTSPPGSPNSTFDRFRLAAIKTAWLGRRLAFGCKWTPRGVQAAALARKEAAALKHSCVQETHITIALGHLGDGFAAERLKYLGFQYERSLAQAREILGTGSVAMESIAIPYSDRAKRVFSLARRLSLRDGLHYFGTDHLFLALLQTPEELLKQLLEQKGLALTEFRTETEASYREALNHSLLHPGSKPSAQL